MSKHPTRWQKGQSGNPSGRPSKGAEIRRMQSLFLNMIKRIKPMMQLLLVIQLQCSPQHL
ncbi:hypothetical protein M2263_004531 [Providencia alcalifaciens]|nr:hypothetical protein [Providencia alcalifaciens]